MKNQPGIPPAIATNAISHNSPAWHDASTPQTARNISPCSFVFKSLDFPSSNIFLIREKEKSSARGCSKVC